MLNWRRRRGGRVAEGARLESVYAGNRIEGSNPSPSANPLKHYLTPDLESQIVTLANCLR